MGQYSCGVLMVVFFRDYQLNYSTPLKLIQPALLAARTVQRVMRPHFPLELVANLHVPRELPMHADAWDLHRQSVLSSHLRRLLKHAREAAARRPTPYDGQLEHRFHRFAALLTSRFERTVYLDNDLYVLSPSLIPTLLTQTLRLADFAAPMDPFRQGRVWGHAPQPQLCLSLSAFRTARVRPLLLGAAQRFADHRHRSLFPDARMGDQTMVYFEWLEAQSQLRVLQLPMEFYCPGVRPSPKGGADSTPRPALWQTGFRQYEHHGHLGAYPCRAVHGQYSASQVEKMLRAANATVTDGGPCEPLARCVWRRFDGSRSGRITFADAIEARDASGAYQPSRGSRGGEEIHQ